MIERLCLLLLRLAARRWRDDGQMLAEWRAELSTMDNGKLGYALSLAASRPHRVGALAAARTIPALAVSFVLLSTIPAAYELSVFLPPWVAAAGAILLGLGCARLTAGLTNVIKPWALPAWVFGVLFLYTLSLAWSEISGWRDAAMLVWPGSAIACGIVVVRLTQRRRTATAWGLIVVGTLAVFVLPILPGLVGFFDGSYQASGSEIAEAALNLAAQPLLHLTLFGLVYTRGLAAAKVPVN